MEKTIQEKYPRFFSKFTEIKKRFNTGWDVLYNAILRNELPADLTACEYEVAKMAAGGLHNGEIAQKLFVTENTVRAHLRVIFQKLDVDRRARLAEKLR